MRKNCPEGRDYNQKARTRKRKDWEWEFAVKSAMIVRDLMIGNPRLAKLGFGEEALGHNAILSGFPRPAPLDRSLSQRRFSRGHVELRRSTGTASGEPFLVATENDSLNGLGMLLGHLLTDTRANFCRRADLLESERCQKRDRA